jgi:hypothetical protein
MITTEHQWARKGKREVCIATARDEKGLVHRIHMWGDPPCGKTLRDEIGKIAENAVRRFAKIKQ